MTALERDIVIANDLAEFLDRTRIQNLGPVAELMLSCQYLRRWHALTEPEAMHGISQWMLSVLR